MTDALTSYDKDEHGVALLRLERAEARNAINTQMLRELLDHLRAGREDPDLRVLVISSNDHMGLSAGADVREELDSDGRVHRMELWAEFYDSLTSFPRPTVAVCHGACVGGGAEIAIACDIRVGGANLRLRFPGAALGVPVGPARLVSLAGLSVAKYALLTAREIGPDDAHRWGLVHKIAPAAAAEDAALKLAEGIAELNPDAVARAKRTLHEYDGVVERSAAEGRDQVEWQRTGPGLPYRS